MISKYYIESLTYVVNKIMKERDLSQSDVCRLTGLPIAIISRVVRNKDDKGSQYSPKIQTVIKIIKGLAANKDDAYAILFSSFPELKIIIDLVDQKQKIYDIDLILYELGYMEDLP